MTDYRETLVSPDGREIVATSPSEANDLRYGLGYRTPDKPAPKAKPDKPSSTETK